MAPLPLPFPASNCPPREHIGCYRFRRRIHPLATSVVAASTYALYRKSYCLHYINTYSTQSVKKRCETLPEHHKPLIYVPAKGSNPSGTPQPPVRAPSEGSKLMKITQKFGRAYPSRGSRLPRNPYFACFSSSSRPSFSRSIRSHLPAKSRLCVTITLVSPCARCSP